MTSPRIYAAGPITRQHYGAVTTGGTDDRIHKQLMTQWYGLTPMTGPSWRRGARCPHHVIGKRCTEHRCVPTRTLWDHARAWRDTDGIKVITLEPWGDPFQSADDYQTLQTQLAALNINITYEGRSPYGASYVLFLKARTAPLQGIAHTELLNR